MTEWFVAHTQPRKEMLARDHLVRQGFAVYMPRYAKRVRHARRESVVPAPLFPRYLFVGFDSGRDRWRAVNGTVGVSYLVSEGDRPLPVPTGVVEALMDRENDAGLIEILPAPYPRGAHLEVLSGALAAHVGAFQAVDDRERVVLLLEILGRPVRVAIAPDAVRPLG